MFNSIIFLGYAFACPRFMSIYRIIIFRKIVVETGLALFQCAFPAFSQTE
jgi:hypothetical protein